MKKYILITCLGATIFLSNCARNPVTGKRQVVLMSEEQEIGHVAARHSVEQQRNAILGQVGLIAGMILSPQLAQFGEAASQGLGLLFLKFGRDAERESDKLGVEYSSKIGYDAQYMAGFFNTLKRKGAESGSAELPDFLSTH